ncbi:FMN-binding negative transcriptional regulator [Pseudomonas sp. RIT-PI-AD]|uniref:FMN-binding negative transcriptional regulator n=1 Tax=Pseudomonas sp. RIT-PI-AD TaxID=3035294 RepID=UPI0021D8BBDA|nr:FMN-binding negative transcriptional regulator [Pseudomonas sp. RIT-PI-AD]
MNHCPFHYSDYRCTRRDLIDRFIDAFPLALITSYVEGRYHSSHIPLLRNPDGTLYGHVDRRNPQFEAGAGFDAHIVFVGPSSYIPPEAYRHRQLPTWNYLAVHLDARVEVIDSGPEVLTILQRTAEQLAHCGSTFQVEEEDPRVVANLPHILGLTITPSSIEGRFKLSQDKRSEDSASALDWLLDKRRDDLRDLLELLKDFTAPSSVTP